MSARAALRRGADATFRFLYPGEESHRSGPQAPREVRAMAAGFTGALVAAIVGITVFRGELPLWGWVSPGGVGLILGGLAALVSAVVEQVRFPVPAPVGWSERRLRAQRTINVLAVALAHCGIALMGIGVVTAVLVNGFSGLRVDAFTSTMITVVLTAPAAYISTLAASGITARKLSNTLAVFLVGGVVVAMLTTANATWWEFHFSELGIAGLSGLIFNATLAVGGLLLASLATLMSAELEAWAAGAPPSGTRNVRVVEVGFAIIGACLVGVSLVHVNQSLIIHNTFATGMGLVFGVILVGLRWILDGFGRAFLLFSDTIAIAIAISALLFWPIGYYNLAAFELVAAGFIFLWLVLFLRHLDVAAAGASAAATFETPESA